MLSIAKLPPDPSCSCDIPQLNTSNDERSSHKLALPEVDLSKPALLAETPLPKFSIRDYVFKARSKDIETSWPFSSENLQLCLKHGVKDVLPPFQALDKVRNQSFKRCTVESCTVENKDKNLSNFDGEPAGPNDDDDDAVLLDLSKNTQLNQKPAEEDCIETTSCRFEGENDFPSTTTSVSQSDDIESLPTNRPSISSLETDRTLPEASVEVEEAAGLVPPPHKTESTIRSSGKKCRLVVKFGANSDRSSTEDITSNCTTVSELTMASKICPVCKIFSSSSNTTLNAHIDQCLSVESTPKWMADSKLTRHKIKPRKTKLMVDIYTTAARCTLEELDRRNGTNWATVATLPTRDNDKSDMPAEGRKQKMLPVNAPDAGDVGAVYIDSNGTKLRILSKFNDAPSVSKVAEDLGSRKPSKGGKGTKFLPSKKKKRRGNKHHKYLKLATQSKKNFSHKSHSTQIYGDQGVYHGEEERCEKNEHQIQKQFKPNDSGHVRQWVCSKRTVVAKKINRKDDHQPPIESDQFCFRDSPVERSQVSRPANVSQNPISSPENTERMKNPFCEARVSDKERSPGRKRVGSPLFGVRSSDNLESSLPQMKRNVNQLSKDSNSVCEGCMLTRPKSTGNCVCLLSSKLDDIAVGPNQNSDAPPDASTNSSRSFHSLSSKAIKGSSLRKTVLAFRSGSSVTESRPDVIKKCSVLRNSEAHLMPEIDEEFAAWYSDQADQQYDLMHNQIENQFGREEISNKMSIGSSTVLKIKQDRALSISQREEAMALKSSQLAPQCHGYDEDENMDSSDRAGDDFLDKDDDGSEFARKQVWVHGQDVVMEPATNDTIGENVTSMCKSVDSELQHKLGNCSESRSSVRSIDHYKGPLCAAEASTCPTDPNFIDGQEIYCSAEVGNGLIGQNVHIGEELDSEIGQANFFVEVDPIPIPGPPGSFLPSPGGDMGSEDLQGNSSLTTSRVQSSQDQHDFIDGDSSDSPISATSTISNPTMAEYDQKYCEPLSSVGPQSVQDKIRSRFSGAGVEPSVESAAVVRRTNSAGVERVTFDGENCKVNKISIEKGPLSIKGDEPCCCQRKERISQGIALNFQDSQLLKRRAIVSVTTPTMGKQMGCSMNTRPGNSDARSEMFSLNSSASSKSEKIVPPITKSSAGPLTLKGSPDAGVKFPGRGSCDSPCTSASNPVLRLMGKNLMVVNKDEDASVSQAQPHSQINHLTSRFPTFSDVSPVNMQNQVYHSYHHMVPQVGQDPHNLAGQCFDGRLPNSFRSQTTLKTPQTFVRGPAGLFPDHCKDGFIASMEPHEYKGHHSTVPAAQQNKSKSRPIGASTYNMEKFITVPPDHCQQMIAHSVANANKEIIILDDIADSEASLATDVSKHPGGLRERQVTSSAGIAIPVVPNYNLRHPNPFSYYHSQDPSLLSELPVVHNATSHAIPSRGANASPARWSCTSEGSGVLQRGPFFSASPSTGHLRSALYNSPSLS